MIATRLRLGAISESSSSNLPPSKASVVAKPVMFRRVCQDDVGLQLYGEVCRPLTLENAPGIDTKLVVKIAEVAAIAHEAAGHGILTVWEHRGQPMAGHQRRELFHALGVEGTFPDQERTNALLRKTGEGRFEIAIGSCVRNNDLQAQRASRRLVCDDGLGIRYGRVREKAKPSNIG
jgi:hypothetical protein